MAKYVTSKKDTLASLAKKYGVTRKQLRQLNPEIFGVTKRGGGEGVLLKKGQKIGAGQTLRLGKGIGTPGEYRKAQVLQDPKYAAFLRNFDYQRDKSRSDFLEMQNKQAVDLARMEPMWARQREEALRNVDESAEARGLYRSGERLREKGRTQSRMEESRQRYIDMQADELERARRGMREQISGLKRQRSEERLGARERLTMRDAQTRYGY